MSDKLRFALIGCGRVAPKHIEALANNIEKAELVALCDLEESKALSLKEKYESLLQTKGAHVPQIRVYTDYRELLSGNEGIDVVSIATYSGTHARIACDAMQASKHVIVEKPMALSTMDAQMMIDVAKNTGKKLTVCHQNRFNPPVKKLREALEQGRFGKLVHGAVTNKGTIEAPIVINAAGPWAKPVAEMVGVDLPLFTQRHQILVTEPVGWILDPMVMSFSIGIYCQQTPHGSLIMGIGDPHEPKGYDIGHSWQFLRDMSRIITRLLPVLKDVRVVRQWSGLYTVTPDAHPILGGVPGLDGYLQAVGFSGHGFMLAPAVGRIIAEMALGMEPFLDVSNLDAGRFERGEYNVEPSVV